MEKLADSRPEKELKKWDQLTQKTKVVGIGGLDAHGPLIKGINFPTYLDSFSILRTHILTEKPFIGNNQHDSRLVYTALQQGHSYICYDYLHNGRGFTFGVSSGKQKAIMGDELVLDQEAIFTVKLPSGSRGIIQLLRNGQVVAAKEGKELIYSTGRPGVYRVEVSYRGRFRREKKAKPWIYSNPIYLR